LQPLVNAVRRPQNIHASKRVVSGHKQNQQTKLPHSTFENRRSLKCKILFIPFIKSLQKHSYLYEDYPSHALFCLLLWLGYLHAQNAYTAKSVTSVFAYPSTIEKAKKDHRYFFDEVRY